MFLTSHLMIAYIIYRVLKLDANIWLFLFFSILPDASWPFYKNHRKESWYHTPLTFAWILLFYPYYIAVLSHFIADMIFYVIRLTPWSKTYIGLVHTDGKRTKPEVNIASRIMKHLTINYTTKWYNIIIEILLLVVTVYLLLN